MLLPASCSCDSSDRIGPSCVGRVLLPSGSLMRCRRVKPYATCGSAHRLRYVGAFQRGLVAALGRGEVGSRTGYAAAPPANASRTRAINCVASECPPSSKSRVHHDLLQPQQLGNEFGPSPPSVRGATYSLVSTGRSPSGLGAPPVHLVGRGHRKRSSTTWAGPCTPAAAAAAPPAAAPAVARTPRQARVGHQPLLMRSTTASATSGCARSAASISPSSMRKRSFTWSMRPNSRLPSAPSHQVPVRYRRPSPNGLGMNFSAVSSGRLW